MREPALFSNALLDPDRAISGSAADELRLAEIQECWALRIGFLSVALGLVAGYFSVMLGIAIGLPGLLLAKRLRSNAVFAQMSANQHIIIQLRREAQLRVAPPGGDGSPPR
jgi:hypothetical protein